METKDTQGKGAPGITAIQSGHRILSADFAPGPEATRIGPRTLSANSNFAGNTLRVKQNCIFALFPCVRAKLRLRSGIHWPRGRTELAPRPLCEIIFRILFPSRFFSPSKRSENHLSACSLFPNVHIL